MHGELLHIDAVEAARVDGVCGLAFFVVGIGEGQNAAGLAEFVCNMHFVKLVGLQLVLARQDLHIARGHEGEQRAALRADRAIAAEQGAQFGLHIETHFLAVAAAGVGGLFGAHAPHCSRAARRAAPTS